MICILDAESESDRSSSIHNLYLILARPNDLDEEEDNIVLNKSNKSLRNLIAAKGKEFTSKKPLSPKLLLLLHKFPSTLA